VAELFVLLHNYRGCEPNSSAKFMSLYSRLL